MPECGHVQHREYTSQFIIYAVIVSVVVSGLTFFVSELGNPANPYPCVGPLVSRRQFTQYTSRRELTMGSRKQAYDDYRDSGYSGKET